MSGHNTSIFWQMVKIDPDCTSTTVIIMYQLYDVLTQTNLWILTTVSTSYPVAKNIKNNWSGNFNLGKLNYRRTVHILQIQYLISHIFSTNSVHCGSYFASQTNWENEIWNTSWLQIILVQIHILGSGPHTSTANFKISVKR